MSRLKGGPHLDFVGKCLKLRYLHVTSALKQHCIEISCSLATKYTFLFLKAKFSFFSATKLLTLSTVIDDRNFVVTNMNLEGYFRLNLSGSYESTGRTEAYNASHC